MMTKKVFTQNIITYLSAMKMETKLCRLLGSRILFHLLNNSHHSIQFTTKIPDFTGRSRTNSVVSFTS